MEFINGLEEPPSTARLALVLLSLLFGVIAQDVGGTVPSIDEHNLYSQGRAVVMTESDQQHDQLVTTATFDTIQGMLLSTCEARGYGEECAKTLLGMLWKESLADGKAIGDSGKARGWFQIHYRLHGITIDCAEDIRCAADWTIDYLEYNGYPRNVAYAVQCHNGCNAGNGYAASALRHGSRLWSAPIFLNEEMLAVR